MIGELNGGGLDAQGPSSRIKHAHTQAHGKADGNEYKSYGPNFPNFIFQLWCKTVVFVTKYLSLSTVTVFNEVQFSVDKKTQLDVTFCILYFSSNSCSTCFGQPCAHHQELTTA